MSFQQRLTNEYVTLLTIYMCITIYICMRCWDGRGSVDGPITLEKLEMKKVPPKKGPPCLRGPFPLILGPPEIRPEVLGSRAKKKESAEGASAAQTLFFFAREHSFSPPFLLLPLPSPLPPSSSSLSFSLPPSFFSSVFSLSHVFSHFMNI